jgi:hypothetical protein
VLLSSLSIVQLVAVDVIIVVDTLDSCIVQNAALVIVL